MKTIRVIDLLNKIANGEDVPKKIIIGTHILKKYDYPKGNGTCVPSYKCIDEKYHINDFLYPQYLNNEVKIIEEEKEIPDKLDYIHPDISCSYNESELLLRIEANKDKINEIIDYLKSKGDE